MIEHGEIGRFLKTVPGFADLDNASRNLAIQGIEIEYFPGSSTIFSTGKPNHALHIVRSGAVQLLDGGGDLVARLAESDLFGLASLMNEQPTRFTATAIEDTLIYRVPASTFRALRQSSAGFDTYAVRTLTNRLVGRTRDNPPLRTAAHPIKSLMTRAPVTAPPDMDLMTAAKLMKRERVSALMVIENSALIGIMTDRDLRNRVIATGRSMDAQICDVMTKDPVHLGAEDQAHDAALLMMQHHIHHLPVTDAGRPIGLVSRADFMRAQTEHPLYVVKDIARARDSTTIIEACARLPRLMTNLIEANVSGAQLGRFITAVTDAATRRFLALAENDLGAPPLPYAWVALGSQARQEQSARSDQDNAIIVEGSDREVEQNNTYFEALASQVNDGLNECGYVYCPGDIMARNPMWRVSVDKWRHYFRSWILEPEETAKLHANIFFDLRCIAGENGLVEALKHDIVTLTAQRQNFLASMARDALKLPVPLGFFRTFVLDRKGAHQNTLNIKLSGIMPIVEIARLRALACGELRIGTRNRLHACASAGELAPEDARSLIDALDFLDQLRLRHQSKQMASGVEPDNHLSPKALSPLARQNLKSAFTQIQISQNALATRFGVN